ncbi:MAG: hypothetical protein LBL66_07085, partial [Clostridiales bacterium]|nr:hypothetical protein [Clostridiales bacterium]
MKRLRKMLLLPIAAFAVFAFGGCGGGSDNPPGTGGGAYPTELPDYEARKGEKEFVIWGFLTPPPTAQHFGWYADAGFNVVHIDPFVYQKPGQPEMYDRLRLAEEYGLKAVIDLSRDNPNDGALDMAANDYTDYPAFMGYRTDEPLTTADAEKIFENTALMDAKYPGREYWVTHTAGPRWGHGTIGDTLKWFYGQAGAAHKVISWDYYVLQGNAYAYAIAEDWLRMAEQYAKAAKDLDKDLYSFIASMSINSQKTRRPSEEDIRYQANVMLAYGSKGIEYFCYTTPGRPPFDGEFRAGDWALVWSPDYAGVDDTATWERTETWYSAQKVNRELRAFEHVFLSFDWQGVMTTKGSDARTSAGA